MKRVMKVIVLGGLALGMFAVAIGAIPEVGLPVIKRHAGHQPAGYGYLYTHSWSDGVAPDTAWVCDTSEAMMMGEARRASVTYMTALYDEVGGPKHLDSVSYRVIYQWSNDLVNWSITDSTGVTTDTLYHNDTLIIRPFEYMQMISRISRPSLCAWDTTGLGETLNPWQITSYRVHTFHFATEAK